MALSLNHVIIGGNLTRDPEARNVGADKMVVNFTIANNRSHKKPDGTVVEEAIFIDCEAWARTAEMVGQYLTKGSPCIVVGRLRQDNWVDKESGTKRTRLKLVVENVQFLGGRRTNETGGEATEGSDDERAPVGAGVSAGSPPAAAQRTTRPPTRAPARASVTTDDEPPF